MIQGYIFLFTEYIINVVSPKFKLLSPVHSGGVKTNSERYKLYDDVKACTFLLIKICSLAYGDFAVYMYHAPWH